MTVKRKLSVACLLLLSLLLMVVSAAAAAGTRDVRLHGPNRDGGGDCSSGDVAVTAEPAAVAAKPGKPPAKAPATRIKPIVPVRGGSDDATHAPRWHSFLPGMFR